LLVVQMAREYAILEREEKEQWEECMVPMEVVNGQADAAQAASRAR
jgi:hypothetical protein